MTKQAQRIEADLSESLYKRNGTVRAVRALRQTGPPVLFYWIKALKSSKSGENSIQNAGRPGRLLCEKWQVRCCSLGWGTAPGPAPARRAPEGQVPLDSLPRLRAGTGEGGRGTVDVGRGTKTARGICHGL